mmetsp:Transcript_9595/g.27342  ORF Transcript_9595/g.27342 Transcript_9595/m.27342 type:complete len:852 (+) Transcript_9595:87-2642(+)
MNNDAMNDAASGSFSKSSEDLRGPANASTTMQPDLEENERCEKQRRLPQGVVREQAPMSSSDDRNERSKAFIQERTICRTSGRGNSSKNVESSHFFMQQVGVDDKNQENDIRDNDYDDVDNDHDHNHHHDNKEDDGVLDPKLRTTNAAALAKSHEDGIEIVMMSLPTNIYSIMFVAKTDSVSFYFALCVFAFQSAMISLALVDLIEMNAENPLKVPKDVQNIIRVAQGLSLVLALAVQTDVREAIKMLHAGYDSHITNKLPHATLAKWLLAYIAQLMVGLAFLVVIFCLVVRSSAVIEIFLNFAALSFISEIDDVAFHLGHDGFLSEPIQAVCGHVNECAVPMRQRKFPLHKVFMGIALAGFLAGWGRIVQQQYMGHFLCKSILVQFGDAYHATLPTYSGVYVQDGYRYLDGRKVYVSRDFSGDKASYFRYCKDHKAWVYQTMEFSDAASVTDFCDDYLMRSKKTESFDITDVKSSDWNIRTLDSDNLQLTDLEYTVEFMYFECNDCSSKTCMGRCGDNNRCICDDDHFGERCELTGPCPRIKLDSRSPPFTVSNFLLSDQYSLLTSPNEDGDEKPVKVHYRPVYVADVGGGYFDVMLFNGRRWMIYEVGGGSINVESGDILSGDSSDGIQSLDDIVEQVTADQFHLLFVNWTQSPEYLSASADLATPSNSVSPTGKAWFHRGGNDAQGFDLGESFEGHFLCEVCNPLSNACFNGGDCINGTCECYTSVSEASGALCEYRRRCETTGCLNGGTCDQTTGICDCTQPYAGRRCQVLVCPQSRTVCTNGAQSCSEDGKCICKEGFSGAACESFDCSDAGVGCLNNATCDELTGCDCSGTGFSGSRCEIPVAQS